MMCSSIPSIARRPRQAVHTVVYSRQPEQPLVDTDEPPLIANKGQQSRFPVKEVQMAIERGVSHENTCWVLKSLTEAGLLSEIC